MAPEQLDLGLEDVWTPSGPYKFKTKDSRYWKKSAEWVMFHDYGYLRRLLDQKESKPYKTKDPLHQHLEWLLARGEDRPVYRTCPVCQENPIKYLSVRGSDRDGYSIGLSFAHCGQDKCRGRFITDKMPTDIPVVFSSYERFFYKTDKDRFLTVLRQVYQIDESPITANRAFNFFSQSSR